MPPPIDALIVAIADLQGKKVIHIIYMYVCL